MTKAAQEGRSTAANKYAPSWPIDNIAYTPFRVPLIQKSLRQPGRFYSTIVGMRLADGSERYKCVDCPNEMWLTPMSVLQHRGREHPTPKTLHRRKQRLDRPDLTDGSRALLERRQAEAAARLAAAVPEAYDSVAEGSDSQESVVAEAPASRAANQPTQTALDVRVPDVVKVPRRPGRPRHIDDDEERLDMMAPHISMSLSEALDQLVQSRAAARAELADLYQERSAYRRREEHVINTLRRISQMFDGLLATLESEA